MKQEHFDNFCELLDTVAEQYSKNLTPSLKMLYWQGLHDKDFEAVRTALFNHIRNASASGKFMPKISDIIEMIEGSAEDSALVAWSTVDKAVREKGTYVSIVFDDSLIHKVLQDMGGWIPLGDKKEEEWPFVAKEFCNRYRGYKSRSQSPDYPAHLIGLAEAHNSKEGYRIDPPVLIGNPEKAKLVMNKGTDTGKGIGFKRIHDDLKNAVGEMENKLIEEIAG